MHQPCNKNCSGQSHKNDVPYLLSLNTIASEKLVSRPNIRMVISLEYEKLINPSKKVINKHLP